MFGCCLQYLEIIEWIALSIESGGMNNKDWRFAIIGNIVKRHLDEGVIK